MCYDIKASYEAQLKRAIRNNDLQAIEEIREKLIPLTDLPLFHASGYSHPKLLIYTNRSPHYHEVSTWGLVPHWVKDEEHMKKLWNSTLNARGETIFEKPSFRSSAKNNRCVIYVDGFYEHHHFKNKTYPFYIHNANNEPLALAGLWSEWIDTTTGEILNTFSIVTTKGNELLSKIHNNPKLNEPRMPLILEESETTKWLHPINDKLNQKQIEELIHPFANKNLKTHTVKRLRGKDYIGNVEEIYEEFFYEELEL